MSQGSAVPSRLFSACRRAGLSALLLAAAVSTAALGFLLHLNLSSAGFIELLLVLLVASRLGFAQATAASLGAFLSLNFLFTQPVFTFTVNDPQNWVALFTFEATALLVSGLSNSIRTQTLAAEAERLRAVKLYELSRTVLLINPSEAGDRHRVVEEQLTGMIRNIFAVRDVHFWLQHEPAATPAGATGSQARLQLQDRDDPANGCSQRILKLGNRTLGGMVLRGWRVDPMAADAIASVAATTFERARAIERENRAEVERDTERLRTAVLDGLAHSFKTPLTAIQTASSGLLAIDGLTSTQCELASIIDERATMLTDLTTRLLQTAALEAKAIHLKPHHASLCDLLRATALRQEEELRLRIHVNPPASFRDDCFDLTLIELALQQLIDNAARYSAPRTPITLGLTQLLEETHLIVENIATPESPIRPEERTRIFERFRRGHEAQRGPSGTGLGLSIVKKIAEAHGGRAWVDLAGPITRFTLAIAHQPEETHA